MAKRILMTGVSSFTGAHIARDFVEAGYEVCGLLTRGKSHYSDELTQKRLSHSQVRHWVDEAPFGSTKFLDAIESSSPQVFVNHGAQIKGYRDPQFDFIASLEVSLKNIRAVFAALQAKGCERIIHSGSIFEPGEGDPKSTETEAISIYGVSKAMAWEALRFFASSHEIPVSKIIIPNPIGRFENTDRLIPFFVKTWKSGAVASLRTPDLIRDNIPAEWLARFYLAEAQKTSEQSNQRLSIRRPNAYAESNLDFINRFLSSLGERAKNFKVQVQAQPSSEPLTRVNREPCPELSDQKAQERFWSEWLAELNL